MNILDIAISREQGVTKLAAALGVRQSVVSNWRMRGLPKPWRLVLEARYRMDPGWPEPAPAAPSTPAAQDT